MTGDKDEELWLPIEGYEGHYEISNYGRVKSLDRGVMRVGNSRVYGRIMKLSLTNGYPVVSLSKCDKSRTFKVHRLVAKHFMGTDERGVNHKDGTKSNNHISNLEYTTTRENINHRFSKNRGLPAGVAKTEGGKYKANIFHNKKNLHLGVFSTKEEASEAYIAYANKLGSFKYMAEHSHTIQIPISE